MPAFRLPLPGLHGRFCLAPRRLLALAVLAGLAATADPAMARKARAPAQPAAPELFRYAGHTDAMAWADEVAAQHGLDPVWVRQQVGAAQRLPSVIRLMQPAPAGTAKNWAAYRARFIEPVRLKAGLDFWLAHRETLARAEAQYGVPASLIVGVVGVESLYGRHTGNFRVIDALATLAFDFPANHPRAQVRTEFFRAELGHYLQLTRESGLDPQTLRGSYAGAMGWPQFMPSSWLKFAVDFDADGRVDLFSSTADVIGSVANYFKTYGWQTGQPTHYPVAFDDSRLDLDALLAPDILPTFSVERFTAQGAVLEGAALLHPGKLALIELQNGDPANGGSPASYLAGTDNFYVVTRYNWSSYYALAVIELGETVQALVDARTPPSDSPAR